MSVRFTERNFVTVTDLRLHVNQANDDLSVYHAQVESSEVGKSLNGEGINAERPYFVKIGKVNISLHYCMFCMNLTGKIKKRDYKEKVYKDLLHKDARKYNILALFSCLVVLHFLYSE